MARNKRQLLLQYPNALDMWQLGSAVDGPHQPSANTFLKLSQEPVRLLQLKAKEDEWIVCSAVSPDGDYIVYSTECNVYGYHFIQATTHTYFRVSLLMGSVPLSFFYVKEKDFRLSERFSELLH